MTNAADMVTIRPFARTKTALRDPARKITAKPLGLTFFEECDKFTLKDWILKGVIAKGETSSWIAPPGAGKSALLTEIAVHAAQKADWRGHKAKASCGVLYLAFERADLVKRRLNAYRRRDGVYGLPITVADNIIDLMKPGCVDIIIATVLKAEAQFHREVGLIIVDTFAKGIAAGGGDEDKAKDQNKVLAHLRRLHELLSVHIAIIGHTGKNEDRGARGSNAHVGDVDLMVQIGGDTIKTAEVIKGNDQPERVLAQFKLVPFDLGIDPDGDAITTSILSADQFEPMASDRKRKKGKGAGLAPVPKAALKALYECVADGATPAPANAHVPTGVTGVTLDIWRDRLFALAIINPDGAYREQFKRIRVTLQNAGAIGVWEAFAWPVT
jgi:hypothetical protein